MLEDAAELIAKEYGSVLKPEIIERAIREQKGSILVTGERVQLKPYLDAACKTIGPSAIETVKKSLRQENKDPDMVVLIGGGAEFYRKAVQDAYPKLKVQTPENSDITNARGFWIMGCVL